MQSEPSPIVSLFFSSLLPDLVVTPHAPEVFGAGGAAPKMLRLAGKIS